MAKPTSLAAQIARQAKAISLGEAKEDAELGQLDVPPGKVRVRLTRPFYDSEGVYHVAGPALLDVGQVPSSAKVLRAGEVAPAVEAAEEE